MSEATEVFARRVAQLVPELSAQLDEHLNDNFGQLLPHVFFGDVVRWVEEREAEGSSEPDIVANYLLSRYAAESSDVQELIYVSFYEDLPADSRARSAMRQVVD